MEKEQAEKKPSKKSDGVAEYACCDCRTRWSDHPGGFARHSSCPACGSKYFRWENYAEFAE